MKRIIWIIALSAGIPVITGAQVNPARLDSVVSYYIHGKDSVVDSRRTYTYDPQGWVIRTDAYDRAVPWTYQESWMHTEFTYDPDGHLKTDSISQPLTNPGDWRPMIKSEYSYNDRNQLSVMFRWYRNFSKNSWEDPYKTEYQYDVNHNLISITRYKWVESSRQWVLSGDPHTYQYNESGRLIRENYHAIDVDLPMDFQLEYSYPSDTFQIIRTLKKHPKDTVYFLSLTEERAYHPDGRIRSQSTYSVSDPNGSLAPLSRSILQYHEDGTIHMKTGYVGYGNGWSLNVRTYYYYPSLVTETAQTPEIPLRVYPNPTTGPVWLSGTSAPARVSVYDQVGQLIRVFESPGSSFNLSFLRSGTYFLVIDFMGIQPDRARTVWPIILY